MAQPTPIQSGKLTPPQHLGRSERELYVDIVRGYGRASSEAVFRILAEAPRGDQARRSHRLRWPRRQRLRHRQTEDQPVVLDRARRKVRSLVEMKMLNLDLAPKALNRKW